MNISDYTLCYNTQDGKLHIGRGCGEEQEKFTGEVTSEIADVAGYSGEGAILKLKNFKFHTSADLCLMVPGGTTIVLEGENELCVWNDKPEANVGVLYSSGDLTLDGAPDASLSIRAETKQGLWSRAVCARGGDLTIRGGKITAAGGQAKKSCGLYAGGHLWIDTGEKGRISLTGGRVYVQAGKNAIRAAEGRLLVAEDASVVNAQEYVPGGAWAGDCLSPVDETQPVIVSFYED